MLFSEYLVTMSWLTLSLILLYIQVTEATILYFLKKHYFKNSEGQTVVLVTDPVITDILVTTSLPEKNF